MSGSWAVYHLTCEWQDIGPGVQARLLYAVTTRLAVVEVRDVPGKGRL